jgi:hypothetical protein
MCMIHEVSWNDDHTLNCTNTRYLFTWENQTCFYLSRENDSYWCFCLKFFAHRHVFVFISHSVLVPPWMFKTRLIANHRQLIFIYKHVCILLHSPGVFHLHFSCGWIFTAPPRNYFCFSCECIFNNPVLISIGFGPWYFRLAFRIAESNFCFLQESES